MLMFLLFDLLIFNERPENGPEKADDRSVDF